MFQFIIPRPLTIMISKGRIYIFLDIDIFDTSQENLYTVRVDGSWPKRKLNGVLLLGNRDVSDLYIFRTKQSTVTNVELQERSSSDITTIKSQILSPWGKF